MIDIRDQDVTTQATKVVDYVHSEIHNNEHFFWTYAEDELDSGVDIEVAFTTPNTTKWEHFIMAIESTGVVEIELYEGTTINVVPGGTAYTPFNSNRNSSVASTMVTLRVGATIDADGTAILYYTGGVAAGPSRRIGAETRNDDEIVLQQNKSYLLRVTSRTDDSRVFIKFAWYEHTNQTW